MARQLEEYRKKRDLSSSHEPEGGVDLGPSSNLFVVQLHRARRLHYDFRIELGGVLKSWAVPKGPSLSPREKRLAAHVEDHPLDYADFEGIIPEGNYGAGTVMIWDRGIYRVPEGRNLSKDLDSGRIELEILGKKMKGKWALVRIKTSQKDWLLIKVKDEYASDTAQILEEEPRSIISGKTLDEIAKEPSRTIVQEIEQMSVPRTSQLPSFLQPMTALLVDASFTRSGWLFEIKYDGIRAQARKNRERISLLSRNKKDLAAQYPEIVDGLEEIRGDGFIIDGEIITQDAQGRPDFHRLQARMNLTRPEDIERMRGSVPVVYVVFDIPFFEGFDLTGQPLKVRKKFLRRVCPEGASLLYSDHVEKEGERFFEAITEKGLEGMIAKKETSPYRSSRSPDWLKVKRTRQQEFVIIGYTSPQGSREFLGSLAVGIYDQNKLVCVSKVGTGLTQGDLKDLYQALKPLETRTPPVSSVPEDFRDVHWVTPHLVCLVRFSQWTHDGSLRHPVFLGLRQDKTAEDCVKEKEQPAQEILSQSDPEGHSLSIEERVSARIKLTHLDKVFWPESGYTKRDVLEYYERMAPVLVPHLKDRPLVLERYPDGITGESFYQKDAPDFTPSWVETVSLYSPQARREIRYFLCAHRDALLYLINLGAFVIHSWASRVGSLDDPDYMILDLDPENAPFRWVIRVAKAVKEALDRIHLKSYPKTSGATGLHVIVPIKAGYDYTAVRQFAELISNLVARKIPDLATASRSKGERKGKVYIDYGQNGRDRTIVAPYAVRALPGAPVSAPLKWDELEESLTPDHFNIKTIPARVEKWGDLFREILASKQSLKEAFEKLSEEVKHL